MNPAVWVSVVLAFVVVATILGLILFFTVGGPFGTLNDIGNALIGVLSALLALMLVNQAGGWSGVIASLIGAVLAIWGSWLVVSGATGFVLAGFVSTVGFGFIGVWLALVAFGPTGEALFGSLLTVARIGAVAMIVGGAAAIAGAVLRVDSYEGMPGWLWTFALGWIGVYVLYPIAVFGLGRNLAD